MSYYEHESEDQMANKDFNPTVIEEGAGAAACTATNG